MMEFTVPCLTPLDQLFFIHPGLEVKFYKQSVEWDDAPPQFKIYDKSSTAKVTNKRERHEKPERNKRRLLQHLAKKDESAKPGTSNSRQTIGRPTRKTEKLMRLEWEETKRAKLSQLSNMITDCIVDEKILVAPSEVCYHLKMDKVPTDPLELCYKFNVELPQHYFRFSDSSDCD